MTAEQAYKKATRANKRLPKLELAIMQDTYWSMCYAINVIKGRWLDTEQIILLDTYNAYFYARDIVQGRWLEAEPTIMQDAERAYLYARDIIQGRWLEAEPAIMKNSYVAYYYAKDILKKRWLEAESTIAKSTWKTHYIKEFFDEPVITKEQVDIIKWYRKKLPGYFAPARLFEDKVSLLDMVIE